MKWLIGMRIRLSPRRLFALVVPILVAGVQHLAAMEQCFDQIEHMLTFASRDGGLRARLSGTVDLEAYHLEHPAPGLIYTFDDFLLSPRLTLFLDAQLGKRVYAFAQSRADRGFDPSDGGTEVRLDEFAIRITPWEDGRLNVQVGQFATVVGNWMERHLSWSNPLINAPLPYESLTPIFDIAAPVSRDDFIREIKEVFGSGLARYEFAPVIWGPSYATGASVAGRFGQFEYAAELKNASLSSRPEAWKLGDRGFDQPTLSARVGFRPDAMWNLGFSASQGPYFLPEAARGLPAGTGTDDYRQTVMSQDISFAWHHLQIWAEFHEARFEVPRVGDADTFIYFVEAKYQLTPQLYGALRWNQQFFGDILDSAGDSTRWGWNVSRIDAGFGYRFTPNIQLKASVSVQRLKLVESMIGHTLATQFTVRF